MKLLLYHYLKETRKWDYTTQTPNILTQNCKKKNAVPCQYMELMHINSRILRSNKWSRQYKMPFSNKTYWTFKEMFKTYMTKAMNVTEKNSAAVFIGKGAIAK